VVLGLLGSRGGMSCRRLLGRGRLDLIDGLAAPGMSVCSSRAGPASGRRGVVLLGHSGRDPAAAADGDAVVFRPGADVAGAPPARRGPGSPAGQSPAGHAACSMNGATWSRKTRAFALLRSIS